METKIRINVWELLGEYKSSLHIALISDTHKLLRESVIPHLERADLILHGGDVGNLMLWERLKAITPSLGVRGNVDKGDWSQVLPYQLEFDLYHTRIGMIHIKEEIPVDWLDKKDLILVGHSHKAEEIELSKGMILNPGSIGPRRFKLPISMVSMRIDANGYEYEFIQFEN